MAAKDVGLSDAKAASLARELTVNFNRKGELGSWISALYLFANASMQGATRMAGALASSKNVRRTAYGIAGIGSALALYNFGAGGDDDDGTPYYLKIPHWVRDTNLILMWPKGLGHDGQYIKVPLPYGYSFFKVIGDRLMGMSLGKDKAPKAIEAIAKSVLDAFDPLGKDENTLAQFTPSVLRPAVHLATNKNWTGRPINPEPQAWNKNEPDSSRYFRSASPFSIAAAQQLNALTGGGKHHPGYIDVSPGTIDYMLKFVTGGLGQFALNSTSTATGLAQGTEWQVEKTPIVRRFYGKMDVSADRALYFEEQQKVHAAYERMRAYRKDGNDAGYDRISKEAAPEIDAQGAFKAADKLRRLIQQDIETIKADKSISAVERERRVKEKEREEIAAMRDARRELKELRGTPLGR
jgi:hypothetical protein